MSNYVTCFDSCFGSNDFKYFVGFTKSIRNIRNSTTLTLFKEYVQIMTGISSSSTFVILSIASQLKAGVLK